MERDLIKCPFCGHKNIGGTDECESCHEDLTSWGGAGSRSPIERILMEDSISRLRPRPAIVVKKETSVLEAVRKMNSGKFGCLLVGDSHRLEGILTERDILFKVLGTEKDLSKVAVSQVMTADPETLSEEDTLAYAVNKMSLGGFRHIPILKEGRPVSVISSRDVLCYLSRLFPE